MGGVGQIGFGPASTVDGPPPIPPVRSLLAAASAPAAGVRIVVDLDSGAVVGIEEAVAAGWLEPGAGRERWMNGVTVWPYPPYLASLWDSCAVGSDQGEKPDGDEIPLPEFAAFTVVLPETCTSYTIPDQDAFKARAVAALTAVESAAVARELLAGDLLGNQPHLADGEGTFPNGDTITSVVNGLALLEGEIARSGKLGLIHMSPMAATFLRNYYVIDDKTGVLRTINGNVVIPDAGYVDAVAPDGGHAPAAAGQEWMYATGPIDIRRSEIFTTPDNVAQALDRGAHGKPNSITYRAERYYLIDWDTTLQAAVLVDRCQTEC
ncbi:MAG: hypothetical protein ACJ79H_04395 [Myxococcales bacterium]